ncbi:8921_t:CDS:2 [Racocetra fulgida]|uniref:8921_t:CDS:1 n=1 Tax=Racocetra fulgida TaxID=60492 RepID=A0A9N8ZX00_9GLOM|nr:8921_t:CDS:2 [Racocetra fulgida]
MVLKSWDEWVAENRVLPINEANLSRQKQIEESMTKKNKSSSKKIVQDSSVDKSKKRKRDLSLDKWVPLPRKPSVNDIISNYKSWKNEKNKDDNGIAEEVSKGVGFYFNKCLGTRLLYHSERNQYKEVRSKFENLENAQIYGAEHLLRLFAMTIDSQGSSRQLPSYPSNNITYSISQTVSTAPPFYILPKFSDLLNVYDAYSEWYHGHDGSPSIISLIESYGHEWEHQNLERLEQRRLLINEIKYREKQLDGNIQEVLKQLENLRDGMSMENLVERLSIDITGCSRNVKKKDLKIY